jgi:thiol-disulfide isomerase/thioredoxin
MLSRALLFVILAALATFSSAIPLLGQDTAEYAAALRKGDAELKLRRYEAAIEAFNEANALKNKQSADAFYGLSMAFYGLQAFKSSAEAAANGLKHVGDNARLMASLRNQRGAALQSMAEKPTDKELAMAEVEFRAVMAVTDTVPLASYNLGIVLLRQSRDKEGQHELQAFVDRGLKLPEVELAKKLIDNPRRARENYAPDYTFTTIDGEFISSKDLLGKTVLLDFWGTWCPPCLAATDDLVRLHKKYSTDPNFVMIGIASEQGGTSMPTKEYIASHKMVWTQMIDTTRKVQSTFQVRTYPSYIVIDSEGIIRGVTQGYSTTARLSDLESIIKAALKKGK